MQKIEIVLPLPTQIYEAISEYYRIDSIVNNYFYASVVHSDGSVKISGATHYKFTQTDFKKPIDYDCVIFWDYYPNSKTVKWEFEDPLEYETNHSNTTQYINYDVTNMKNFKDFKL